MNKMKFLMKGFTQRVGLCVLIILTLVSCNGVFEYSPYVSKVKGGLKHITSENINWLMAILEGVEGDVKFAVISDTHYDYKDLQSFIDHMNSRSDISFVIVGGDLADKGLLKEYEFFESSMKGLNKPYFTVIGNHDYLASGGDVYRQMFGAYNYSLETESEKLIFFDDVFWESNKRPDFDWLENELKNAFDKDLIVITHIPPFGDQFNDVDEKLYQGLMSKYNVKLSIHGHVHTAYLGNFYEDNTKYLVVPSMQKRTFYEINLSKELDIKEAVLR